MELCFEKSRQIVPSLRSLNLDDVVVVIVISDKKIRILRGCLIIQ